MKILCVIRASTIHQETASQKSELIEFCKSRGFVENDMVFIEVAGASARKCNPQYLAMLYEIKSTILSNPDIKNVALWHLNRLGRVESKLHEMKEFFVKNKIQVYIKEPNITLLDDNGEISAAGSITFSVYASMVKYETDEMFAKMNRGKDRLKAEGKYVGGQILYGISISSDKTYTINKEEADEIRLIFELYSTGRYTLPKLTEEIQARGYKQDYWSIRKILSNRRYISDKYPEIISKELFETCEKIRIERAYPKSSPKKHQINLAVGILKCSCGYNYMKSTDHYLCRSAGSKFMDSCGAPTLKISTVHSIIYLLCRYGWLADFLKADNLVKEDTDNKIAVLNQKMQHSKATISDIKNRIDVLEDAYYIEGKMSEDKFNKRHSMLQDKIKAESNKIDVYESELARLEEQQALTDDVTLAEKFYMSLYEFRYNEADFEQMATIKLFANAFIKEMRCHYLDDHKARKMKTVEITATDKFGNIWTFRYNPYIAAYKKPECPLTMAVNGTEFKAVFKPLDEPIFSGNQEYNPEILDVIRARYGITKVAREDFIKALNKRK